MEWRKESTRRWKTKREDERLKKGLFGARFSLLSPNFFLKKKTSQLLPVFFLHLAAAPLPFQCMCCPQNLLQCMCCPKKTQCMCCPGFFLPLAAAPFPRQCMCCPQNLLQCMCYPKKTQCMCYPVFSSP
ncbi:unnamed protein product, partial [Vitis vinifera]|uniref:Uncharacterized protein n=1 Tax=Vitis vinifera TaxID=29760 RepID=D7TZE3_VITVI